MSSGSYLAIWPVFGAANQLLAALSLLAIGVWLKGEKKSNLMVVLPMCFMFAVCFVALASIIMCSAKFITTILSAVLFVLALALVAEARKALF